ncbi:MAG: formylglycine-generating enzyme family protein [Nostocales cyanobacterium ELA583]|jgi:formylglycine-generating enzyme required for sulfatase activity
MTDTQQLPISIQPTISYPQQAEVGKTYLMTIDLIQTGNCEEWNYEEEEYPIYFRVDTTPLFKNQPIGEPAVVLHRFGGTYGAAKFLLTAADKEMKGEIRVTLVSAWGVSLKMLRLQDVSVTKENINSQEIDVIHPRVEHFPVFTTTFKVKTIILIDDSIKLQTFDFEVAVIKVNQSNSNNTLEIIQEAVFEQAEEHYFNDTEDLLNELFQEVKSQESHLSGGSEEELTQGAIAVKKLQQTKVTFANPDSRLIPLTVEGFKAKNVQLNYKIQELMKRFDFYSMVISVNFQLQPSVLVSSLKCNLKFSEKEQNSPLIHNIIPDSKWQSLVNAGVNLNLGLDTNLDIAVGIDAAELTKIVNLPDYDKLKASVRTKDKFKGFIILDSLNYKCGEFSFVAQGVGDSQCYWKMQRPEIQEQSTIKFGIIFKVPKGWESIDLIGEVSIEPSIDWLTGELSDVMRAIPSHFKNIFGNKETAAQKFAIGTKEIWNNIKLPKPEEAVSDQTEEDLTDIEQSNLTINRYPQQATGFIQDLANDTQLEMMLIPGGTFIMGSAPEELEHQKYESPQHSVTVQPFFMGKYQVTQAQWRFVAQLPQVNRELEQDPSHFKGDNRPVESVSWEDAVEFCDRLSQYTGRTYRLPSEAEWEYACRAGTTTPFYFGETITTDLANYNGNYTYGNGVEGVYREETTEVGSFGVANNFGLYDMHGNVREWCQDSWHSNYEGAPIDGSAWLDNEESSDNTLKLLRGGSWFYGPDDCRSVYRDLSILDGSYHTFGFRVVCSGAART